MMYSLKQVLKQEPAAIVAFLTLVNSMLIAFNLYTMTDLQLSLTHAVAFGFFTLIYIRPATVSKDALNELNNALPPTLQTPPLQTPAKSSDVP